jgi:pheromone shutdown protein TraB
MKEQKPGILKDILSGENGHLSSKRVLGAIVLLTCLICVVVQAAKEGVTDNLKELFEWLIITSTALLGITSVTSIWKGGKTSKRTKIEEDI